MFSRNEENSSEIFQFLSASDFLLHKSFKDQKNDKIAYILNDFEKKKEANLSFAKNNL
jgi:hypothetical protein